MFLMINKQKFSTVLRFALPKSYFIALQIYVCYCSILLLASSLGEAENSQDFIA